MKPYNDASESGRNQDTTTSLFHSLLLADDDDLEHPRFRTSLALEPFLTTRRNSLDLSSLALRRYRSPSQARVTSRPEKRRKLASILTEALDLIDSMERENELEAGE
jgi:hypothetical protein